MDKYNRHNVVIPSLIANNAKEAIEFYKKLFGAKELYRLEYQGKVTHAELGIGNSVVMIADEIWGKSAKTIGDTPIVLYVYVIINKHNNK